MEAFKMLLDSKIATFETFLHSEDAKIALKIAIRIKLSFKTLEIVFKFSHF